MSAAFHTTSGWKFEDCLIEYTFKRLGELNKFDKQQLEKLTLENNSCMRDWLWRDDDISKGNPVMIMYVSDRPIGWCMIERDWRQYTTEGLRQAPCIGVFVAMAYRGHGIAKALITRLLENCKDEKLHNIVYVERAAKLYKPILEKFGLAPLEM